MTQVYENILQTVGNTPVVRINELAPPGVELYAKLEAFNPMGSVKDRLAVGVIEAAERDGSLQPGQTVIEATSGNTGIGLAMVCAQKGYPLVIVMAENFSVERRRLMRFLGARVVLTPASEKGSGMLAKATELAEKHDWFFCRQFENEANADAHSRTTAPEILETFADRPLDYWVSGFGTGGTLKGVARVLKVARPDIRIVACEPDNAGILGSGIDQPRTADGAPAASHPSFRPHLMQGWSPDFIPGLAEAARADALIDAFMPVSGGEALHYARELARKEGIFTGITGGATLAGAIEVGRSAPRGSSILCMLPDTGERYLSTVLFDDIPAEMTAEELEISASTARFGFAAPPPASAPTASPTALATANPAESAEAATFVERAISKPDEPVVMFALEWCEFCWSLRKMFSDLDIPFRAVDLDSVKYQKDNLGGDIRLALGRRTQSPTIPQIFVGGAYIGGCTETFDAYSDGSLQSMLADSGIAFTDKQGLDPYTYLPTWLHPRQ